MKANYLIQKILELNEKEKIEIQDIDKESEKIIFYHHQTQKLKIDILVLRTQSDNSYNISIEKSKGNLLSIYDYINYHKVESKINLKNYKII